MAELKKTDEKKHKAVCQGIREDGAYIEAGENDMLIVRKLEANQNAFGVFGYSFLDQNADKIQGSKINGVEDTYENISSGKYPISRSLFFYVKKAHVGVDPWHQGIRRRVHQRQGLGAGRLSGRQGPDRPARRRAREVAGAGAEALPTTSACSPSLTSGRRACGTLRRAAGRLAALRRRRTASADDVRTSRDDRHAAPRSHRHPARPDAPSASTSAARGRSRRRRPAARKLHSLPGYYGCYVALWCGLPALLVLAPVARARAGDHPQPC